MPVTRNEKIAGGIFAGVLGVVALTGAFVASDDGSTSADAPTVAAAIAGPGEVTFEANFATPDDFYNRFDYGYSGLNPFATHTITQMHGDHNLACQAPTTLRDVHFTGSATALDFAEIFWHCAPGGADTGHLMTGYNSSGYNIAWFSPKQTFTGVTKVCFDVNETEIASRKWLQMLFVGPADAIRFPAGTVTYPDFPPSGHARGTGGFDLGYTSPDFRDPGGPTTRIHPQGGTLAGLKLALSAPSWFQDQDTWMQRYEGPGNMLVGVTDKATRYEHCLENLPDNKLRLTQQRPGGPRTFDFPGQIPDQPVRIVFEDDTYDAPKSPNFNADVLTWHWDNIRVYTAGGGTSPTTTQATTSTTSAVTTTSSTTIPASTTSSTQPSSTSEPTTTLPGTPTTSPNVAVPRADLEKLAEAMGQALAVIEALLAD